MIKKISIETEFGWLGDYESGAKIFKIKFRKEKNK